MKSRTRPAIFTGPSGNIQRSINFMCAKNLKNIVIRSYTPLPMPDSIIKKIEKLVYRDRTEAGILFRNRKKNYLIGKMNNTMILKEIWSWKMLPILI